MNREISVLDKNPEKIKKPEKSIKLQLSKVEQQILSSVTSPKQLDSAQTPKLTTAPTQHTPEWYEHNMRTILKPIKPHPRCNLKAADAVKTEPVARIPNTKEELHRLRLIRLQRTKMDLDYEDYIAKVETLNKSKQFLRTYAKLIDGTEKTKLMDKILRKQTKLNAIHKQLFIP